MKAVKRFQAIFLSVLLVLGTVTPVLAAQQEDIGKILTETAAYLMETAPAPQVGSVGGEWVILGLARSGCAVPQEYYDSYYSEVEDTLKNANGVLSTRKYTEYSRVITAVSALGKDARNIGGYDLTLPLGDYEKTVRQGTNGAVWALIALDTRGYPVPKNAAASVQATRQMYVDDLLNAQHADGGWGISANTASDADMTAMVLQALAKYREQQKVSDTIDRALAFLKAAPRTSCESTAQMIVALCELGQPVSDVLVAELLSYRAGAGFCHESGGAVNQMASEQAFYALAALGRSENGQSSLYTMDALAEKTEYLSVRELIARAIRLWTSRTGGKSK